jgi:putative colanic acid biosynthesis acetyltransferase WcaF
MQLSGYSRAFDRGAPRWKEMLWILVSAFFFRTSLPWPSIVRVKLLRAFGARVGVHVVLRAKLNVNFPWRLTLGDHVWIGEEVMILSLAPVELESHVCISQRAFLCTGSHDFRAPHFDLITEPITIRERSWVAAQAFIGPGVKIGPGSMVTAGSVVTANVPPGVMVRGNPAEIVRRWDGVEMDEQRAEPAQQNA